MRKILLTYSSFVIACLVVIVGFITATTYIQLAAVILLYPLLVFFAFKILPLKTRMQPSKKPAEIVEELKRESVGISDIDKRVFLKLIGGAGLFLFFFSIFNKRAEGLFFKNLPPPGVQGSVYLQDTSGNKIDPATKKTFDDYSISDIENNVITYYGFISKNRAWYIMQVDTATGAFRYSKASSNYSANWNNRANLKYDFFDNVFYKN